MNPMSSIVFFFVGVSIGPVATAADDCDAPYQASIKSLQTPHHTYSAKTLASGVKSPVNEAILIDNVEYVRIHGNWQRSSMVPRDMIATAQEKLKSRPDVCRVVKTDAIGGDTVTTYRVHNKATDSDSQVRISKSTGLLQGQSLLLPDKSHMEIRYEYKNVHFPGV